MAACAVQSGFVRTFPGVDWCKHFHVPYAHISIHVHYSSFHIILFVMQSEVPYVLAEWFVPVYDCRLERWIPTKIPYQ